MISLSSKQLLDYKFYITALEEKSTLRNYFKTLLRTLWNESDGFSGKRQLGDSDWQDSLAMDMIEAALLEGEYNAPWDRHDYDSIAFDIMIKKCISAL